MGAMSSAHKLKTISFGNFPLGVEVVEQPMSLKEVTFVGGKDMPGHRWYKLRPNFAPLLVQSIYETNGKGAKFIVDPYSGAGTTVLTAKAMGVESYGVELNPFLASLSQRAIDWSSNPDELEVARRNVNKQIFGMSADGWTCGFPIGAALDAREAMIAVAMNGTVLPLEHGYPARVIIPVISLKGEISRQVMVQVS